MSLTVMVDTTAEEFLKYGGPLLYQDEPTNKLMLGYSIRIAETLSLNEKPVFIRILKDGVTTTAAVISPINLILTYANPEEIQIIADYLNTIDCDFPGAVGPARESELFAEIWSKLKQRKATLGMGQKIYKIEKVSIPPTLGELRLANPDEAELITQWIVEFSEESLPPLETKTYEKLYPQIIKAMNNNLIHVWVFNGQPVATAQVSRPTQNGISVSAVYTPKHFRKNGFASAVVAHLSQKMLDSGKKFCVLYTDLANPTSNQIYQNIGYKEVVDSKQFLFLKELSL